MTSPSMTAGEETTAPPVPLEKGQREGATLPPLRDMEVVAIGKVGEDHRGTRVLQCLCHLLRIFNTVLAGMHPSCPVPRAEAFVRPTWKPT